VIRRRSLWPARRGKGDKSDLDEGTGKPPASRRRRPSLPPTPAESFTDEEAVVVAPNTASRSLGVGTLHRSGSVRFESIPKEKSRDRDMTAATSSSLSSAAVESVSVVSSSPATTAAPTSSSTNHHYLRISDLRKLDASLQSSMHGSAHETESSDGDDVHDHDPIEQWLWLGCATNSPVAVNALAEVGWTVAMNPKLWSLASGSVSSPAGRAFHDATFQPSQCPVPSHLADDGHPVLVWTGKLHGLHRSDLPAVRAAAVLNVSPSRLADLLVDSGRVKEYNPHSQGRVDLHVLQSSLLDSAAGTFGGVTKIVRSSSKPPLLRKPLEFTSLFHARAVMNGRAYLIVTRSVSNHRDGASSSSSSSSLSEILLSVNLLLPVGDGEAQPVGRGCAPRTLMITVNHIYSPLIPTLLAKRIGVQAAASYLADLKQCIGTE
jgi:hypothetical protein